MLFAATMRKVLFISIVFACFCSSGRAAAFELLTRAPAPIQLQGGNAPSGGSRISPDGNLVLFMTTAKNLGIPSNRWFPTLCLLNRTNGEISLVPTSTNGLAPNAVIDSYQFADHGRKVLFETSASNLVTNDTNTISDIYLWDFSERSARLISVGTNGFAVGGTDSSISADARRIAFVCYGIGDVNDTTPGPDIYTCDIEAGWIRRLDQLGDRPVISENGRYVAFYSGTGTDGYSTTLWDLDAGTATRIWYGTPYYLNTTLFSGDSLFLNRHHWPSNSSSSIVRYHVPTGKIDSVATNSGLGSVELTCVGNSGGAVIFKSDGQRFLWQEAGGARRLPISLENTYEVFSDEIVVGMNVFYSSYDSSGEERAIVYDIQSDTSKPILPVEGLGKWEGTRSPDPNENGSFVAFESVRRDEYADDFAASDVYLWESGTDQASLVSKAITNSIQVTQKAPSSLAKRFSISDDGRRVVYQSLEAVDDRTRTNPVWNIFLLDRSTGQKQLLSRSADGLGGGNKASYGAVISGNGSAVAYFSKSTNLVENPQSGNGAISIIVKDMTTGAAYLANRPTNVIYFTTRADNLSWSRDGKYLLFTSDTLAGTSLSQNLFLFSMAENQWTLLTVRSDSRPFQNSISAPFNAVISPDGNYVAFQAVSGLEAGFPGSGLKTILCGRNGRPYQLISSDPNRFSASGGNARSQVRFTSTSSAIIFGGWTNGVSQYYNIAAQTAGIAATNCVDADISDDLRWSAFTRLQSLGPTPTRKHVFLRNLTTGQEIFVTTNSDNHSYNPHLTSDGRFLIFESRASNLVTNDFNDDIDIFMYNRVENRTELITRTPEGRSANRASQRPVLSGDSSTIVFKTHASDLIEGDFNEAPDLLAFTLPNLKITIYEIVGGKLRLVWDATPGQTYRIQTRESLTAGDWADEASSSGEVEIGGSGSRFYRVVADN
jgi:hypothetical protein